MLHIKQAVIVEGKYDKIKLSSIVDAVIIPTGGFKIFKDKETLKVIRYFAETTGIIILTDSDTAGFKIRSFLKGAVKNGKIINVYVPDIFGKEKRKTEKSKEGKLGVEGISEKILLEAFQNQGILRLRQQALVKGGQRNERNFNYCIIAGDFLCIVFEWLHGVRQKNSQDFVLELGFSADLDHCGLRRADQPKADYRCAG